MTLLAVVVILIGVLYDKVPSSFVPEEDQGYYIVSLSLPDAASMNRTTKTVKSFAEKLQALPGSENIMAISGNDMLGGGAKSSAGTMFVRLKSWSERTTPDMQIGAEMSRTRMLGSELPEATVIAMNPPSLPGLGMVGGFSMQLEDRGGGSLTQLESVSQKFIEAARKRPEIGQISSSFKENTPGYEFEVDREKTEAMGVSVDDVFTALQVFLGGSEVNDFNKFGRTYKVIVQAETPFRSDVAALRYFYVKGSDNTMIPLNTLLTPKKVTAPTTIKRFNGFKAVQLNGSPESGYSSGQALTALGEVAKETLPSGYTYDWFGQSREEKQSGNRTPIVFGLAIVLPFCAWRRSMKAGACRSQCCWACR